jgi:hypothetical protein
VGETLALERIASAIATSEPPPPLRIEPRDIAGRLPEARKRLAAVAAYRGVEGDYWGLWLACVDAEGTTHERAVQQLSEDEAYWLAAWCFGRQAPKLGFLAFERHLAILGEGESANPFATWVYLGWALREQQAKRDWAAFGPVREHRGCGPSDEVLFAAVELAAGHRDRPTALRVIARFAKSREELTQAARAVALDELGDRSDALSVVAGFDRETVFSPSIGWLMRDRFGSAFDEAMQRKRPPRLKVKAVPGFVATPSSRKTPYCFAPDVPKGPPCRGCGHPLRVWFSFDVASISGLSARLPRWHQFRAPACLDCNFWMLQHDFVAKKDDGFEIEAVEQAGKGLGKPLDDYSARPLAPQYAKLAKAPRDLDERPLDGDCQVGGSPVWIQDAVEMRCRGCDHAMEFVFRMSSPNEFNGCPEVAGGSGALYYFACPKCPRFSVVAQWT